MWATFTISIIKSLRDPLKTIVYDVIPYLSRYDLIENLSLVRMRPRQSDSAAGPDPFRSYGAGSQYQYSRNLELYGKPSPGTIPFRSVQHLFKRLLYKALDPARRCTTCFVYATNSVIREAGIGLAKRAVLPISLSDPYMYVSAFLRAIDKSWVA